jgi:hypothetical protein
MEKAAAGGLNLLLFHFLRTPFPSSSQLSDADLHRKNIKHILRLDFLRSTMKIHRYVLRRPNRGKRTLLFCIIFAAFPLFLISPCGSASSDHFLRVSEALSQHRRPQLTRVQYFMYKWSADGGGEMRIAMKRCCWVAEMSAAMMWRKGAAAFEKKLRHGNAKRPWQRIAQAPNSTSTEHLAI